MIFKITEMGADTCGNEWSDGEPTYLEATSAAEAWKKLGKQSVVSYQIGRESIEMSRTPKGAGYGIWELNPEFNWKRDMGRATSFRCSGGGFGSICVDPIKVKK